MPEKITIVKESGESITSNVMSVFMIPETNKQYIITTENAVDPHGLTVLHVSEISENNLLKVQTDDEWSSIKTIMRAIISNNVGSYKYIPTIINANAKDLYSRDISVSAGAAKQLLESYTNGPKEVPVKEEAIPEKDPNAIESDSIFPTANVETDENAEIAPGLSTVETPPVVEKAKEEQPTVSLESAITDDQVVNVPIIDNNQIVETPAPENQVANIPVAEAAAVTPVEEPPVVLEPAVAIPEADGTLEVPVTEVATNTVSQETTVADGLDNIVSTDTAPTPESVTSVEPTSVEEVVPVTDAGVIPVAVPVMDEGVEATPAIGDNLVPVTENGEIIQEDIAVATPVEEAPIVTETTENAVTPAEDVTPIALEPASATDDVVSVEDITPASDVAPVEDITPVEDIIPASDVVPADDIVPVPDELKAALDLPVDVKEEKPTEEVVEIPQSEPVVNNIVNATIDEETVKDALNEVIGDKIETTLSEKVSEILPNTIQNTIQEEMTPAIENTLPNVISDKIKEPIAQSIESTLETLIEEKIQAPLMQSVTDTVNETIVKQSKALNSCGIKLDFGVESSFGQKASLDEIVAGAQELFVEGVKNLIMVMTERVYKELRVREEELKKREVIVSQREQAVNDKTLAMMNGTYNPNNYQNYTPAAPAAPVAPEMNVAQVATPTAQPVVAPVTPVVAPVPEVIPEVAVATEVVPTDTPVPEAIPTQVPEAASAPVPEVVQEVPTTVADVVPPVADVTQAPVATPEVPTAVPAASVETVPVTPVETVPTVPVTPATPAPVTPVEAVPAAPVDLTPTPAT